MTDLDAIKARLAAATPGPWEASGYLVGSPGHCAICRMVEGTITDAPLAGLRAGEQVKNDLRFIEHAPTDVQALLTALHAAQARAEGAERDNAALIAELAAARAYITYTHAAHHSDTNQVELWAAWLAASLAARHGRAG